jgi:hypothetical protein
MQTRDVILIETVTQESKAAIAVGPGRLPDVVRTQEKTYMRDLMDRKQEGGKDIPVYREIQVADCWKIKDLPDAPH